jgi:hypothetical protein
MLISRMVRLVPGSPAAHGSAVRDGDVGDSRAADRSQRKREPCPTQELLAPGIGFGAKTPQDLDSRMIVMIDSIVGMDGQHRHRRRSGSTNLSRSTADDAARAVGCRGALIGCDGMGQVLAAVSHLSRQFR